MNIKCEVIKDLLPLYVDGVVSDESRELIEEHLKTCPDCSEYCRLLREETPDVSTVEFADEAASLKRIKRRITRNQLLSTIIIATFIIIVLAVINSFNLAEYQGSLEENLSFELPAGYELSESPEYTNGDGTNYIRDSEKTTEILNVNYYGTVGSHDFTWWEDPVQLDEDTQYYLMPVDWDHYGYYNNYLECEVLHGVEAYVVTYQCREKGKNDYYSSCSEQQQKQIIEFVKSFEYHRPSNEDVGNVFKRLYLNLGVAGFALLGFTLLIFVGLPIGMAVGAFSGSGEEKPSVPAVSSKDMHESMNRDREARGEPKLPPINNVGSVSTNTLARRDHSWSSVPDFFIKLFRRK
ncbi:MAG: zf-HC2 domain-containing protein [Bacillota bacterium]